MANSHISSKTNYCMPQRTNPFQKLIFHVNQSLINDKNVKVTESALLKDKKSQNKREVDILIEYTEPYPLKIGIECQDRKRKTSQPDIEQLKAKHEQLNIHKTIIVSKNGFTKGAQQHAQHDDIELITLDDALEEDWPEYLDSIVSGELISQKLFIKNIHFYAVDETIFKNLALNTDLKIFTNSIISTNEASTIDNYVYQRLKQVMRDGKCSAGMNSTYWNFDPPIYLVDINGQSAHISTLRIDYELKNTSIPLKKGSMGNNKFVYGMSTEIEGYDFVEALITPSKQIANGGNNKLDIAIHIQNAKNQQNKPQ